MLFIIFAIMIQVKMLKFLLEIKPDRYLVRILSGKEFSPFSEQSKKRIKKVFNDLTFEVNFIL
jgi:hypothetical protein